jgi:uncharacterized protein YbcC (UPF0753/DUF2309 family)
MNFTMGAFGITVESRKHVEHVVEHLAHVLPAQGPIDTFVHHNTLHGFEHLPFEQAVVEAERILGGRGYLRREDYLQFFSQKRITQQDLDAACTERGCDPAEVPSNESDDVPDAPEARVGSELEALFEHMENVAAWGGPAIPLNKDLVTRVRAAIRHHVEQRPSLHSGGGVATTELARLCLTVVHDLGNDSLRRRGFDALCALESAFSQPETSEALIADLLARDPRRRMNELAKQRLDDLIGRLGRVTSHRDLLLALTGEDIHEHIHPRIVRVTIAFLDEGLAAWHIAGRSLGFYDSFRKIAEQDRFFDLETIPGARAALKELPPLAIDAIVQSLEKLGVHHDHWHNYLQRIAVALPGLSGMACWRAAHPDYPAQRAHPIDLIQFLAVRLFLEVLFVRQVSRRVFGHDGDVESFHHYFSHHLPELMVRDALFGGELPDFLAERVRAQLAVSASDATASDEMALARLAEMVFHYQQIVADRQEKSENHETRESSDAEILPLWHAAYEIHYRDAILDALAQNAKSPWKRRPKGRPKGQFIFCIDDREEAIRRHIEELRSDYETFGAAGFFGVPIDYVALGEKESVPLCPIVVTPAHRIMEAPRANSEKAWGDRSRRTRTLGALRDVVREVLRNPVSSYFLIDIIGLFSMVPIVGRLLFPRTFEQVARDTREGVLPVVDTEIPMERPRAGEENQYPPRKTHFTDAEQADRVTALLRNMGLVKKFAPLIVLLGHGSESRNNPHLSAYDCGACGGKHGGPNARVYSRMANRPEIREILRTRNINIPDDTWFVGAEHNTATDIITYYDLTDMPESFRPALDEIRGVLQRAGEWSAHERCRKFESAPENPSPASAFAHVNGRTADLSQARPELGHATNAMAIVGPRKVSEGVFLDRRSFLISYDPSIDPEGTILEGILLAVGPVGAGINLEYYFSTVDNVRYGCGTKVPHNIAGLVGVMEGASGDLRTGLPRQMIEIHEAMRLLMIVTAKTEILGKIYQKLPVIQQLVGNAWVQLVAMDPETNAFSVFVPGKGFVPWKPRGEKIPIVKSSKQWYDGKIDFLDPVLIRPEVARA